MVTKSQILKELGRRIDAAKERGDWQSAELYAATAHRVNETRDLAVSGLSRRIAAIDARTALPLRNGGAV